MNNPGIPPKDPAALREYAHAEVVRWTDIMRACDMILGVTSVIGTAPALSVNGEIRADSAQNEALARFLRKRPAPALRRQGLATILLLGPLGNAGIRRALATHGLPLHKPDSHSRDRGGDFLRNSMKAEIIRGRVAADAATGTYKIVSAEAEASIREELKIQATND